MCVGFPASIDREMGVRSGLAGLLVSNHVRDSFAYTMRGRKTLTRGRGSGRVRARHRIWGRACAILLQDLLPHTHTERERGLVYIRS